MSRRLDAETVRLGVVAALVLAMLIPLAFVQGVAADRQRLYRQAADDIAASWGPPQALTGPVLLVPEIHGDRGEPGRRERRELRVVVPQALEVSVDLQHRMRARAIHEVPVYEATARIEGTFVLPEPESDDVRVLADEARLLAGIAHTRAIDAASPLTFAGATAAFTALTGEAWPGGGVQAPVAAPAPGVPAPFSFELTLRGSRTFAVAPVGAANRIAMTASWPHPSFGGRLPAEHQVGRDGFSARWTVHELARELPATWLQGIYQPSLRDAYATVALFQPVTGYTRVDRGIKYGVLFIGLTFLALVCFEMTTRVRLHSVQYAVVGAGLVLFYLTLLSLSEHLPFLWAYVVAVTLLGGLVTWYAWVMTRHVGLTLGVLGVVLLLYVCLYVLLALEAYALLVGSGVLLLALAALMQATKHLTLRRADPAG